MLHLRNGFVRMSIFAGCVTVATMTIAQPPDPQQILNLGLRGVYFVPNEGQWRDRDVIYGLRSRGIDVAFRESALTMHMSRQSTEASPTRERGVEALTSRDRLQAVSESNGQEAGLDELASSTSKPLTLTVTFPGSNTVDPIGAQPQTARFNYFVGGEGRNTAANVPSFAEVVYENLYDGIDLHVTGSDEGILKYEFHCAPGADYNQIQIHYDGIDSLCIDDSGNLRISTSLGTLGDGAPIVWQVPGISRDSISAHFELVETSTYRIALDDSVDNDREIIIDPDVSWMLYLGGSDRERTVSDVAVDSGGNAVATGSTSSADFEGRINNWNAEYDGFVLKVSPAGVLRWMTYVGGSGTEYSNRVAVAGTGSIVVVGSTLSDDFAGRINSRHPLPFQNDAFVLTMTPEGQVVRMRYVGGSYNDTGEGLAIDTSGNVYLTGTTQSDDFEGRNNTRFPESDDAYVLKISAAGELSWMTYLGGRDDDSGADIIADDNGDLYATGSTRSSNFRGKTNAYHGGSWDAYVARVNGAGILQWATYLGGSESDYATSIAIAFGDEVTIAGYSYSRDFEGRSNSRYGDFDTFVLTVKSTGVQEWMAYFGGRLYDRAEGLASDENGNAYVSGRTSSVDFVGADNSLHHLGIDAFVFKINRTRQLEWMTYLGGTLDDFGQRVATTVDGFVYTVGRAGSLDFEGRLNSYHGGDADSFLLKLFGGARPELSVVATCPTGGPIRISWEAAIPNGQTALLYARALGEFVVPNGHPCAGTALGLGSSQIQLVFVGPSNANGSRTLNSTTGPNACGGYLQLLDLTTCATSNVARIE